MSGERRAGRGTNEHDAWSGRKCIVSSAASPSRPKSSVAPGVLLGLIVFGTRIVYPSFIPMIGVASAILWSMLLYFGVALWNWGQADPTRQSQPAAKYVFVFWVALLLPWLLIVPLSGVALTGATLRKLMHLFGPSGPTRSRWELPQYAKDGSHGSYYCHS